MIWRGRLDDEQLLNVALLSLVLDGAVPRSVAEDARYEPHDGHRGFEGALTTVSPRSTTPGVHLPGRRIEPGAVTSRGNGNRAKGCEEKRDILGFSAWLAIS